MKPVIVSIRAVKNGRFQAELVDSIQKGKVNVLKELNKGDSAFDSRNIRHAWFPITLESMEEIGFNVATLEKAKALTEGEKLEVNLVNPKLNGELLRIQLVETVIPTPYQYENVKKTAKQIDINAQVVQNTNINKHEDTSKYLGKKGYFVTDEGEYIFSNTTVEIQSQVQHKLIEGNLVPEPLLEAIGMTLAKPVKVSEGVTF